MRNHTQIFFNFFIIVFLFGALLVPSISSYEPVSVGTVWVDDNADPSWYDATHVKTIQEGVDNASVGDTIYVWAGTYYGNVSIGKTVTLIGNGTGISIVDLYVGPIYGLNVFDVNADSVNISGFSINDGWYGINISSVKNCNISNNHIYGNWQGIYLSPGSSDNIISGNKCSSIPGAVNYFGIYLSSSSNNSITGNNVSDNDINGIHLTNSTDNVIISNNISDNYKNGIHLTNSNDNVIISNNASGNWHGIYLTNSTDNVIISNHALLNSHYGIYLNDSQYNTIKGNNIKNHTGFRKGISLSSSSYNIISGNNCSSNGYSIHLSSSSNNNITGNNISDSRIGIHLELSNSTNILNNTVKNNLYNGIILFTSSSNNIITGNNISDNTYNGIELYGSSDHNIIYNNYFDNPLYNAYDYCINDWNITKTLGTNIIGGPYLGGNFWSDYTGVDTDGDALGDTLIPYNTSITNGGDYHPLVFNSVPIANFTYTPISPTDLDTISFTDASLDYGGSIVNWSWDFDDGDSSFDQNPTHQYSDDGIYNVCLTVKDDDAAFDTYCTMITVLNVPPVASFTYLPLDPTDLNVILFTDNSIDSDGSIVNWSWDFDDGDSSFDQNPSHQYADDGVYTVCLTVKDDDGAVDIYCTMITVLNVPPVADANGPYDGLYHDSVQFDGSGSYDPDGTILSYEWDFGDGDYGTGMITNHIYDRVGIYTVILTVTDNDGSWNIDTTTVQITYEPIPSVLILYPIGGENVEGTIDIQWIAHDTSGGNNVQIVIYLFDSEGDFTRLTPDPIENVGTFGWDTSTVPDGEYKIEVSAIQDDKFGIDVSDYFTVKNHEEPIENLPPNKPFKPSGESSGKTGNEYSYQSSTSDPDGDQVYYKWDWGDESSGWLGPYDGGVTITTPHNWDEDGNYSIKVKAKDVYGDESSWSDPLTVTMPKNNAATTENDEDKILAEKHILAIGTFAHCETNEVVYGYVLIGFRGSRLFFNANIEICDDSIQSLTLKDHFLNCVYICDG
ncbi:NosD domain-containing protein [Thermoplasmatota archaeon]